MKLSLADASKKFLSLDLKVNMGDNKTKCARFAAYSEDKITDEMVNYAAMDAIICFRLHHYI